MGKLILGLLFGLLLGAPATVGAESFPNLTDMLVFIQDYVAAWSVPEGAPVLIALRKRARALLARIGGE